MLEREKKRERKMSPKDVLRIIKAIIQERRIIRTCSHLYCRLLLFVFPFSFINFFHSSQNSNFGHMHLKFFSWSQTII